MKYYIKNVKVYSDIDSWNIRSNDKAIENFKFVIRNKVKNELPDDIIDDFYFGIQTFCDKLQFDLDEMDYIDISPSLGSINKLIKAYNEEEKYSPFDVKLIRNSSDLSEYMISFNVKLISRDNKDYMIDDYEINIQGLRCKQAPNDAKSYISILNKIDKKYKGDHQIKILNIHSDVALEFVPFCNAVGKEKYELNSKLTEMHNDFFNILIEVFKNKKGYFSPIGFRESIYNMFEHYLDEFGWEKLSHQENMYLRDDYTYKFDASLKRDNKNEYKLCIWLESKIISYYHLGIDLGCSAYIRFPCLYK